MATGVCTKPYSGSLKALWTNPNPTADFSARTITLASAEYDFLLVWTRNGILSGAPKGQNFYCRNFSVPSADGYASNMEGRDYTYVDATHYSVGNGYAKRSNSGSGYTTMNGVCVPLIAYGLQIEG